MLDKYLLYEWTERKIPTKQSSLPQILGLEGVPWRESNGLRDLPGSRTQPLALGHQSCQEKSEGVPGRGTKLAWGGGGQGENGASDEGHTGQMA